MRLTFYAVCDWNCSQNEPVTLSQAFFYKSWSSLLDSLQLHCTVYTVCVFTHTNSLHFLFFFANVTLVYCMCFIKNCKNTDNIVNITEEERRKYKLPNNRAQTILFFADLYSWYLFEENRNLMSPISGSEV